ncbi:neuroepithelial cell-transforming gene 1 protein [Exaiptasia diaphana]|uniref:Rho guanine nucleotide exchange factor 3 n=1 Tax=Exaiptasia diaphana TaxID=2652724 RepID=A0A913WY02_EXADI|nr:neuroepithelial cell-transforming gene 1 protein [Exaiptasia diaphana]
MEIEVVQSPKTSRSQNKQQSLTPRKPCAEVCVNKRKRKNSLRKRIGSPWKGRLRERKTPENKAPSSCRQNLFGVENLQSLNVKDFKKKLSTRRKRKLDDNRLNTKDSKDKEPDFKKAFQISNVVMSETVESPPTTKKKLGGNFVQRSFSLRVGGSKDDKDERFAKKYRILPTPIKIRPSKLWRDTVSKGHVQEMSPMQLKRQEAMFELSTGEEGVVSDLKMMIEVYYKPMYKLKLMSEYEFQLIFGCVETLLKLHEELIAKLKDAIKTDGTTDCIGEIMLNWFPQLKCYTRYCANQFEAKAVLDEKMKNDVNVQDFLQRCQDSPFSRRLDLWSFLDSPRSRLVKYPLMIKSIMKLTPRDHPDRKLLEDAKACIEEIIEEVDKKTGEAKCQFVLSRIVFLYDNPCSELYQSKRMLCSGTLKNKHGTKLQAFLFEKAFLLTRPATRGGRSSYQVFTEPILTEYLHVEDLPDGDVRLGGSFKTALSRLATSKNVFRVSCTDQNNGQSHTLQAPNDHDKRQWLSALQSIITDTQNYKTYV